MIFEPFFEKKQRLYNYIAFAFFQKLARFFQKIFGPLTWTKYDKALAFSLGGTFQLIKGLNGLMLIVMSTGVPGIAYKIIII